MILSDLGDGPAGDAGSGHHRREQHVSTQRDDPLQCRSDSDGYRYVPGTQLWLRYQPSQGLGAPDLHVYGRLGGGAVLVSPGWGDSGELRQKK